MKRTLMAVLPTAVFGLALAGEPGKDGKVERKGPLAALPSQPGPHIEKLQGLGDNQWLKLDAPAPDPKWGKARSRSWGAKMAFARDLRGAFLTGEGGHGWYNQQNGQYMDDVWFYDVNANKWVCIYPGTNVSTFTQKIKDGELKLNDNCQIVDKDGQPLPVACFGAHSYHLVTYDPDGRRFAWLAGGGGKVHWLAAQVFKEGQKLLDEQRAGKKAPALSPWFYETVAGRFEQYAIDPAPDIGGGLSVFMYVEGRKQFFMPGVNGAAFFDPAARKWTRVAAKGPRPSKGMDYSACYDSKRDRIYLGGGVYNDVKTPQDNFFIYEVKTDTWSKPDPKGSFPVGFTSSSALFHYDSASDKVVCISDDIPYGAPVPNRNVYTYDPEANAFCEKALPVPPEVNKGQGLNGNAFYDPEINAHFCFFGFDNVELNSLWVYRFKKSAN